MPRLSTISVLALAAVVLAGCGGGSSSAPQTTTTSSAGGVKDPGTSFSVKMVSGVGNVLVDAKGRTVYTLTSSGTKNVPCTDANGCTAVWPDLPLPSGTSAAQAGTGVNASLLGTMKLSDGETYPTYHGYLVYEYTGDTGPGQSNGEELKSFGGTWYALTASGMLVKKSSSGTGYGY